MCGSHGRPDTPVELPEIRKFCLRLHPSEQVKVKLDLLTCRHSDRMEKKQKVVEASSNYGIHQLDDFMNSLHSVEKLEMNVPVVMKPAVEFLGSLEDDFEGEMTSEIDVSDGFWKSDSEDESLRNTPTSVFDLWEEEPNKKISFLRHCGPLSAC